MSRSRKHSKDLKDFLSYSGRKMSGKERNVFEKRLQKDAFDAEAAEGFSIVSPDEVRKDLNEISKRLNKRKKRGLPVVFLRIAAVVTLLLATAVILRIVRTDEKTPLVTENIAPEADRKPLTITASEGIQKASEESRRARQERREQSQTATRSVAQVLVDTVSVSEIVFADNMVLKEEIERAEGYKEPDVIAQVIPSFAKKETQRKRKIEGTVISTEDKQPIPGATVVIKGTTIGTVSDVNGKFSFDVDTDSSLKLIANFIGMTTQEVISKPDSDLLIAMNASNVSLDEVVVVGYGTQKSKDVTGAVKVYDAEEDIVNQYVPPVPTMGNSGFKKYIESNIQYPPDVPERTKEVVVLSIMIRSNGNVDNITVVRSPGEAFSDEAIRLIKEGPLWKPATLNGIARDEEVKVRIVFK